MSDQIIVDKNTLIKYIKKIAETSYKMGWNGEGVIGSGFDLLKDSISLIPFTPYEPNISEVSREDVQKVMLGSLERNEVGLRQLIRRISKE